MSIALGIILGFYALAFVIILVTMHWAPEAHQDETGFHLIWINDHSNLRNVAVVWN